MEIVKAIHIYITAVDVSWNIFLVTLLFSIYFPETNTFFEKYFNYNPKKVLEKYYEKILKGKYNDGLTTENQTISTHIWVLLKVLVVLLILRIFYFFTFPYVIYKVFKNIYKNICTIKK